MLKSANSNWVIHEITNHWLSTKTILLLSSCCITVAFGIVAEAQEVQSDTQLMDGNQSPTFAGHWKTAYGPLVMTVKKDEVEGVYPGGTLKGTLKGRKLSFTYTQPSRSGTGEFELSEDGQSFNGRWRESGKTNWSSWIGKRINNDKVDYSGLWNTTYGKLRLNQHGDKVTGNYGSHSSEASVVGTVKNGRLEFRYIEQAVEGVGWFELSDDGQNISGKWHPDSDSKWRNWSGDRVPPNPGKTWLIVLEADWEKAIAEPEYSFADMLEHYFKMSLAKHVEVRKRSFHDSRDLSKFCREVKYLAEPVVLLIASHGTAKGISVGDEIIGYKPLADSLRGASNIKVLHLSGCAMMAEDYPKKVFGALKQEAYFPISGYKTCVGWDASAIGDFTYLSMLLIHRLVPEHAVKQSITVSPYLGEKPMWGARYQALGLSIQLPPKKQKLAKNEPGKIIPEPKEIEPSTRR